MIRKLAIAAVPLAGVAALALGGTAHAAAGYADTSVTGSHYSEDAFTAFTASYGGTQLGSTQDSAPLASPSQLAFSAAGSTGPVTYSIAATSGVPAQVALAIDPVTGTLTVTQAASPVTAPAGNVTVTVKATDGTAVAYDTVTAAPEETDGQVTAVGLTAASDIVTLGAGVVSNAAGTVLFTSSPVSASTVLGNAPAGLRLAGGVLSAVTAVPGTYKNVTVTARDMAGATAAETFTARVKGGKATSAPVPVLSHGAAQYVSPNRENVEFESTLATWAKFTIVGPGAINGHTGWVKALGNDQLNQAVYSGLEANHGYTVYYQPFTAKNGSPVIGARTGYVYFKSNVK